MTAAELEQKMAQHKASYDAYVALDEQLQTLKAEQEDQELGRKKQEFLSSSKGKKLLARVKDLMTKAKELSQDQVLEVTLPVKITLRSRLRDAVSSSDREIPRVVYGQGDIWASGDDTGVLGPTPDLNRVQRSLLQGELQTVVENACDGIMNLFPGLEKGRTKVFQELNKALNDLHNEKGDGVKLTWADVENS